MWVGGNGCGDEDAEDSKEAKESEDFFAVGFFGLFGHLIGIDIALCHLTRRLIVDFFPLSHVPRIFSPTAW